MTNGEVAAGSCRGKWEMKRGIRFSSCPAGSASSLINIIIGDDFKLPADSTSDRPCANKAKHEHNVLAISCSPPLSLPLTRPRALACSAGARAAAAGGAAGAGELPAAGALAAHGRGLGAHAARAVHHARRRPAAALRVLVPPRPPARHALLAQVRLAYS